jgi:hypothetical protein
MSVLPGLLSLTSIADGSLAVAADVRNNYASIQAAFNALLGELDDGAAGDFLSGVGTTIAFAKPPGYEYAYNELTAPVSITATTEGTANTVVTASSVTFDGSTPVIVEFYSPEVLPVSGSTLSIILRDDTAGASLGRIAAVLPPAASTATPVFLRRKLTPAAGARVYSIRAYTNSGTASVNAGAGGAGADMPAFIRITKV